MYYQSSVLFLCFPYPCLLLFSLPSLLKGKKLPRGISGVSCGEHLKVARNVLNQFFKVDLMNKSLIKRRRIA